MPSNAEKIDDYWEPKCSNMNIHRHTPVWKKSLSGLVLSPCPLLHLAGTVDLRIDSDELLMNW